MNIASVEGFDRFLSSLCHPTGIREQGLGGDREQEGDSGTGKAQAPQRRSRVDLVLSCVDNYEARMVVNQVGDILCHKADG